MSADPEYWEFCGPEAFCEIGPMYLVSIFRKYVILHIYNNIIVC